MAKRTLKGAYTFRSYAELKELSFVYRAVTLGDVWRFGRCNRATVEQDINLYTVPDNLDRLTQILGDILIA